MEINFDNLNQAIAALEQCASENKGKQTDTGAIRVSDLCRDVATFLKGLASHDVPQPGEEGTFGQALECLKRGFKVAMADQNGDFHVVGTIYMKYADSNASQTDILSNGLLLIS
jgi:hypothetical protein